MTGTKTTQAIPKIRRTLIQGNRRHEQHNQSASSDELLLTIKDSGRRQPRPENRGDLS